MLAEVLRTHPHVRGTLVDLPRAIKRAHALFSDSGVADRIEFAEQSFFDPLPKGADLYLLKSILSDWPDPEAARILRRCAEAMADEGRVVVVNGVVPDDVRTSLTIESVLLGGKIRSLSEFLRLAEQVGLRVSASGYSSSGRFLVECRSRTLSSDSNRA